MKRLFTVVVLLACASLVACGDDDDVGPGAFGAFCRDDFDCPYRCEEGYCTFDCNGDAQCPGNAACIDEHGGVCAPLCGPAGCGAGYHCESTNRRGSGGDVMVCRN